jgi:hypothetical protein
MGNVTYQKRDVSRKHGVGGRRLELENRRQGDSKPFANTNCRPQSRNSNIASKAGNLFQIDGTLKFGFCHETRDILR